MNEAFQHWFHHSQWAGAGKDAGELAKAAWDAALLKANQHSVTTAYGSQEDVYKLIWRLREICAKPYQKKHGHAMTLEQGWAWEMIHFIHHALSDEATISAIKEDRMGG